ncbi:hypothetical protein E4191_10370 [Paracoccus liaowanqingii]|uniref:Uncharacterized protein n=1 Tax=Paracoccus liaowanqingii TaxID=2560053 RepID=A0A4P7HLG7_9RHOB|nr:hypothetical protein [Paracoccus liaowanqingii]QBX35064.1 hypothetical protein E4191_10370 [Paracoccus liaowanqingii]
MTRLTLPLLIGALILSGCGRFGDSGWNPLGWGPGTTTAPQSIIPEGGYAASADLRPAVPQILGADWQPLPEGRLLVLRGFGPVKGYHSAALVTARPQPGDALAPDADGVLRLRFVAVPPAAGSPAAALPASPATDTITVALPLSFVQLSQISAIEIAGAGGTVTLRR